MSGKGAVWGTRSMIQLGKPNWDDIKIMRKSMGHLISVVEYIWDSKLQNTKVFC